jgi:hypothetical protein
MHGVDYREGIEGDTDGSYALVLWLPLSTTERVSIEVGVRNGGSQNMSICKLTPS